MIREVTALFTSFYLRAVSNICQNCMREFISDELTRAIEESKVDGASPEEVDFQPLSKENEIFRFSDSSLVASAQQILEKLFYIKTMIYGTSLLKA